MFARPLFRSARRLAAAALVAAGAAGFVPAALAADSRAADIAAADSYLNGVTTLRARFLQTSGDGSVSEGTIYLSRPGRLRLEYDPPSPVLVVAKDGNLIYYDKQLQQVSYVAMDSTLAGVLVGPKVSLDAGNLKVVGVTHPPGALGLTVTRRDDPRQGQITLVFTRAPFQLRQWRVVDAQGQITTVSLSDAERGIALDSKLFEFVDPRPKTGGGKGYRLN